MLNAADLAMLVTVFGCAASAGLVAASQKAGWLTLPFVVVGLAFGFGFGFGVNKLAYRILYASGKQTKAIFGWGLILAYTTIPLLAAFCAMAFTGGLAYLTARHVL